MFEVLQVKQLKKFQCTSKDCVDNCCHSWGININKATFKKYNKRNLVDMNHFTITDKHSSNRYAKINLKEDGTCPFFCEDGLCEIHKKYGYKNLSDVCRTYPQKTIKYNEYIEKSFSLSCPSVLDILFSSDELLEFDLDANTNKITKINGSKDGDITEGLDNIACFELRSLAIKILQDRQLNIKERLFKVGRVCEIIQHLVSNEFESNEILAYIMELNRDYKEEEKLRYTNDLSMEASDKIKTIKALLPINKDLYEKKSSKHKGDFAKLLSKSLDEIDDISIKDIDRVKEKVINPYINKNQYILENYLVYKLFSDIFPKETNNVTESFKLFINKLLILELFMIVLYKNNSELTLTDVKNAIYFFERQVDHSKLKKKIICNMSERLNLDWITILELIF